MADSEEPVCDQLTELAPDELLQTVDACLTSLLRPRGVDSAAAFFDIILSRRLVVTDVQVVSKAP
jgi:hypothetical protein